MKLTPKVELAIKTAARLHISQTRKGDGQTPYIVHPFAVAIIVSEYTEDEDVIAAALLHDVLEDTSYTASELGRNFGQRVKEIVLSVSEPKAENGQKLGWRVRKNGYLKRLESSNDEALLVCAADKINNLSSMMEEFQDQGVGMWIKFSASAVEQLQFYKSVLEILEKRLDSEIVLKLRRILEEARQLFLTAPG
ncbi:MAG: HD domain-containing protein [bacterium]|nr:HD domain-containing protein [bacterium]